MQKFPSLLSTGTEGQTCQQVKKLYRSVTLLLLMKKQHSNKRNPASTGIKERRNKFRKVETEKITKKK
jgi:hypothetical protein